MEDLKNYTKFIYGMTWNDGGEILFYPIENYNELWTGKYLNKINDKSLTVINDESWPNVYYKKDKDNNITELVIFNGTDEFRDDWEEPRFSFDKFNTGKRNENVKLFSKEGIFIIHIGCCPFDFKLINEAKEELENNKIFIDKNRVFIIIKTPKNTMADCTSHFDNYAQALIKFL